MMKILTAIFWFVFLIYRLPAALPDYSFSHSLESWQALSSGTILGNESSDDQCFVNPDALAGGTATYNIGFPIGFDFNYDGQNYDRFGVHANGWIGLGKSAHGAFAVDLRSSSYASPLDYTTDSHPREDRLSRIAGFARDLAAQSGASISFDSIGSAPNRILIIQWLNYRRKSFTDDSLNFQIRLHESSSKISIVYGAMSVSGTVGGQIGLRAMPASEASNFANRTTADGWSASLPGSAAGNLAILSATNYPASGTCFNWQGASNPLAEFSATPLSGNAPLSVQFTDLSMEGEYPITSRIWSFGDGGSSNQQHPSHTFQSAGTYSVSLTVTDSQGNQNTQNKIGYITVHASGGQGQAYLQMQGFDAHLSWDPITTDENGQPMQPEYYYLYFNGSNDPEGEYYFLAPIPYPSTGYIHYGVGRGASHMFYRVKAVQ
jgi:PKD repeat protein